jgi:hypothetical protein
MPPDRLKSGRGRKKNRLPGFLALALLLAACAFAALYLLPGLRPNTSAVQSAPSEESAPPVSSKSESAAQPSEEGPVAVKMSLDNAALAALIKNSPPNDSLKDLSIQINEDDTLQAGATINTDYLFDEVLAGRLSREDVKKSLPLLGNLPDELPVEVRLAGAVRDNKADGLEIRQLRLMGIPLPQSMVSTPQIQNFVKESLDGLLEKSVQESGAQADLIEAKDGSLVIEGLFPAAFAQRLAAQ